MATRNRIYKDKYENEWYGFVRRMLLGRLSRKELLFNINWQTTFLFKIAQEFKETSFRKKDLKKIHLKESGSLIQVRYRKMCNFLDLET